MKRQYIHSETESMHITPLSFLCVSGAPDRVSSNIDIHGGDNSGDVTAAF